MKLSGLVSFGGSKFFDADVEFHDTLLADYKAVVSPSLQSIVASIGVAAGNDLGEMPAVLAACTGWIHQDDDAHEDCSLTACLNPLHPGPCKGWKGTLFKAAPHAYHALEAARVEKANKNRLAKIQALKDAGKPIPKKLLEPIVAKPHPHAGKTANVATGEAHAAGQAVTEAGGVHVQHPGKVSLGQAVKTIKATDATNEKGAKGKKPTVMSKGIAAVIAQEKVTPQYKLDKASKITPEQWDALSADEKSIIRGELANIQKEGFGPQQKKATELLDKLPAEGLKTIATPEPPKPESPKDPVEAMLDAHKSSKPVIKEMHEPKAAQEKLTPLQEKHLAMAKAGHKFTGYASQGNGINISTVHSLEKKGLLKYVPDDEYHGHYVISEKGMAHELPAGVLDQPSGQKLKSALPNTATPVNVQKLLKQHGSLDLTYAKGTSYEKTFKDVGLTGDHEHLLVNEGGGSWYVTDKDGKKLQFLTKTGALHVSPHEGGKTEPPKVETPKVEASKVETPKIENAVKKPVEQPAHIQHAINMATHAAPGAGLSTNHLAAYQKLTGDEFDALPKDVQDKIIAELHKGLTKFLDPKKKTAATKLIAEFGHAGSVPQAADLETPKASVPNVADMTPAMLESHAKDLLGPIATSPNVNLNLAEAKAAKATGDKMAAVAAQKYSQDVLEKPHVAAKYKDLQNASFQLAASMENKKKLEDHIAAYHSEALKKGTDAHGKPLTPEDKKIIQAHADKLRKDHAYIDKVIAEQQPKLIAASKAFTDAANEAESNAKPATPAVTLTDYDKNVISDAYSSAWSKHANAAVNYGIKTYGMQQQVKAHPEYPALTQDLSQLKKLTGDLALAHAALHTAELNVPTDPETGAKLPGPEKDAWLDAVIHVTNVKSEYDKLHKQAQSRLDKIRTDAGLKKRTLPKADTAAVKATAAESGYYKSGGYSGPNFNKPTAAKNYMMAKVGPKLAVPHQTASDKKLAKLAQTSTKPVIPKIENVPSEPVKLGDTNSTIAHVPVPLKKQITADFKAMPKGKYLADPASDIFDNLVNLAAAHGKTVPGGLSVGDVVKTIDETHSKNLGVSNAGMLEKKVTEWLQTAQGKAYAESHSTPDASVVKQLSGEIDLPPGVTLEPGQKVQKLAGPGPYDPSIPASSFKGHTSPEAQAIQDAYMQANGIKLTQAQKKAIRDYTGNGHGSYTTFNAYLRGEGSGTTATKQAVVNIQAAMMPLQENTLLKRGTGWPPGIASFKSNPQELVGKVFEDKGFVSSSVAGSGGHFSGQPLQLVIEAPKGTPAIFVNSISQYKNSENEMLLAAGTSFQVISVEKTSNGHTLMRVRVVGDK